jgi:hypothetical protein
MEDCDTARENMLNHVKKEQLHPQRRKVTQKNLQQARCTKNEAKPYKTTTEKNKLMEMISMMMPKTKKHDYTNSIYEKQL